MVLRLRVGSDRKHTRALRPRAQERKSAILPGAVACKSLRLDGRPCMRIGRYVDIGDMFQLHRRGDQQRRIAPEGGLGIPAREIAARRLDTLEFNQSEDQQNNADRRALAFEQIAVGRAARRVGRASSRARALRQYCAVRTRKPRVSSSTTPGISEPSICRQRTRLCVKSHGTDVDHKDH